MAFTVLWAVVYQDLLKGKDKHVFKGFPGTAYFCTLTILVCATLTLPAPCFAHVLGV